MGKICVQFFGFVCIAAGSCLWTLPQGQASQQPVKPGPVVYPAHEGPTLRLCGLAAREALDTAPTPPDALVLADAPVVTPGKPAPTPAKPATATPAPAPRLGDTGTHVERSKVCDPATKTCRIEERVVADAAPYGSYTVVESHERRSGVLGAVAEASRNGHERRQERREHRQERRHHRRCG